MRTQELFWTISDTVGAVTHIYHPTSLDLKVKEALHHTDLLSTNLSYFYLKLASVLFLPQEKTVKQLETYLVLLGKDDPHLMQIALFGIQMI